MTGYSQKMQVTVHSNKVDDSTMGLSAIQGEPCARFLQSLLPQLDNQEEHNRQFKASLARVGMWQILHRKPSLSHLFKTRNKQLTATRLLQLLSPVFSEMGSNRRTAEDMGYGCFVRYVKNVAAGRRGSLELGHILSFVTGLHEEPVMGFVRNPSLKFSELPGSLPTASTCSKELYLPNNIKSDEEQFNLFDLAFFNEYFGRV